MEARNVGMFGAYGTAALETGEARQGSVLGTLTNSFTFNCACSFLAAFSLEIYAYEICQGVQNIHLYRRKKQCWAMDWVSNEAEPVRSRRCNRKTIAYGNG